MTTGGRTASLVVVGADGRVLGETPAVDVATPWWQDLEPVLDANPGLRVLRLLDGTPPGGRAEGGRVRYVAEEDGTVPVVKLRRYEGDEAAVVEDHPLRMPWARPGGPAADLAWAEGHGRFVAPPRQVRSWNLSALWRLSTTHGPRWLKCVPRFFAHEAAVIAALGPSPSLPVIVAAEGHRLLLEEMPGVDGYDADASEYEAVVDALVDLQTAGGPPPVGLPDWRPDRLLDAAVETVAVHAPGDAALGRLLDGWAQRWTAITDCGLPDVVFHGDAHPGNARIGCRPPVVFDWGDSGFGHPLFDLTAPDSVGHPSAFRVRRHWLGRWAEAAPGADPARAWKLLRPVAELRAAVVFRRFLDGIETSEAVYHRGDVPTHLARAAALA